MCQKGGSDWTHSVSNDLVHWWTLPDALDPEPHSPWDGSICDGTVSFPDLGHNPFNGSTPIMLYGPDCGQPLPPIPPRSILPSKSSPSPGVASGDYPRVAIALPATGATDPYLTQWVRPKGNPIAFNGTPCSFPGRVWKSSNGDYWNMLCAWDGRRPWARYTTKDPTLLTGVLALKKSIKKSINYIVIYIKKTKKRSSQ